MVSHSSSTTRVHLSSNAAPFSSLLTQQLKMSQETSSNNTTSTLADDNLTSNSTALDQKEEFIFDSEEKLVEKRRTHQVERVRWLKELEEALEAQKKEILKSIDVDEDDSVRSKLASGLLGDMNKGCGYLKQYRKLYEKLDLIKNDDQSHQWGTHRTQCLISLNLLIKKIEKIEKGNAAQIQMNSASFVDKTLTAIARLAAVLFSVCALLLAPSLIPGLASLPMVTKLSISLAGMATILMGYAQHDRADLERQDRQEAFERQLDQQRNKLLKLLETNFSGRIKIAQFLSAAIPCKGSPRFEALKNRKLEYYRFWPWAKAELLNADRLLLLGSLKEAETPCQRTDHPQSCPTRLGFNITHLG